MEINEKLSCLLNSSFIWTPLMVSNIYLINKDWFWYYWCFWIKIIQASECSNYRPISLHPDADEILGRFNLGLKRCWFVITQLLLKPVGSVKWEKIVLPGCFMYFALNVRFSIVFKNYPPTRSTKFSMYWEKMQKS